MDWRAPSWQESLDKYHCWLEKEDTESLEKWGKSLLRLRCCCHPHCVAAGKTLERWRSGACVARCGWGYGTVPASCAVGWTRCAVVPGQEGALDGGTKKAGETNCWKLLKLFFKKNFLNLFFFQAGAPFRKQLKFNIYVYNTWQPEILSETFTVLTHCFLLIIYSFYYYHQGQAASIGDREALDGHTVVGVIMHTLGKNFLINLLNYKMSKTGGKKALNNLQV